MTWSLCWFLHTLSRITHEASIAYCCSMSPSSSAVAILSIRPETPITITMFVDRRRVPYSGVSTKVPMKAIGFWVGLLTDTDALRSADPVIIVICTTMIGRETRVPVAPWICTRQRCAIFPVRSVIDLWRKVVAPAATSELLIQTSSLWVSSTNLINVYLINADCTKVFFFFEEPWRLAVVVILSWCMNVHHILECLNNKYMAGRLSQETVALQASTIKDQAETQLPSSRHCWIAAKRSVFSASCAFGKTCAELYTSYWVYATADYGTLLCCT